MTKYIIIALSIIVPVLVATLFVTTKSDSAATCVHNLPLLNAIFNGSTATILVLAVYFVKQGNELAHKRLMGIAFVLGVLFMVSYVTYHASVPSTKFGDANGDGVVDAHELLEIGSMRVVYLGVLLSHILMAVVALPLILIAFNYGLKNDRVKHRKFVKFTFPVWLYVSITGVVVYFLISPYY